MKFIGTIATPADLTDLVLREEDALEVSAGWRDAVMSCLIAGRAVAYRNSEGALAGIFGIQGSLKEKVATVWLLCTAAADRHPVQAWRISKDWLRHLQGLADAGFLVGNFVPKHSKRNRAFIHRLGFIINDETNFFHLPPRPNHV